MKVNVLEGFKAAQQDVLHAANSRAYETKDYESQKAYDDHSVERHPWSWHFLRALNNFGFTVSEYVVEPVGAMGPQGIRGESFRGEWRQGEHYKINDIVTQNGTTYIRVTRGSDTSTEIYESWAEYKDS